MKIAATPLRKTDKDRFGSPTQPAVLLSLSEGKNCAAFTIKKAGEPARQSDIFRCGQSFCFRLAHSHEWRSPLGRFVDRMANIVAACVPFMISRTADYITAFKFQ